METCLLPEILTCVASFRALSLSKKKPLAKAESSGFPTVNTGTCHVIEAARDNVGNEYDVSLTGAADNPARRSGHLEW